MVALWVGIMSVHKLHAQNPKIKQALDKAGLKYTVDKDGDFKMVFDVGEERSQVVFVMSATEELGGVPIVEVWSPAYKGSEISDAVLLQLLSDGNRRKIGGWEISASQGQIFAIFKAKIPLPALSPQFLRSVAGGVAAVADEIEGKVMGGDDF
jgi:thiamine monophosphate kinase